MQFINEKRKIRVPQHQFRKAARSKEAFSSVLFLFVSLFSFPSDSAPFARRSITLQPIIDTALRKRDFLPREMHCGTFPNVSYYGKNRSHSFLSFSSSFSSKSIPDREIFLPSFSSFSSSITFEEFSVSMIIKKEKASKSKLIYWLEKFKLNVHSSLSY